MHKDIMNNKTGLIINVIQWKIKQIICLKKIILL